MRPGDPLRLRVTDEPLTLVAVVDAAGTLLVEAAGEAFQVSRDEVETEAERHGCGCCG